MYENELGIWLDENLTFDTHVKKLCSKLAKSLFFIRRAQNFFLQTKPLLRLNYALFHSHLLYCPIIISGTANKNVNKLTTLQKGLRIITRTPHISKKDFKL